MKTAIISAFCGTGKTYFCENIDMNSVEIEYWKYKDAGLQRKYIKDIKKYIGNVSYIFISTDPEGLRLLHDHGFKITLIYPGNNLRNEYLDRYIDRDSPYDFIGTFMKHWHLWIDELKKQEYCNHIILKTGEYHSDKVTFTEGEKATIIKID